MGALKRVDEYLLSIVIKALNEEQHIRRCIESALRALQEVGGSGEVILADSLSTDATVDLAKQYPVRIVQLVNPADRSCGAGAQLGYQYANGQFVYVLDGDMELLPGFMTAALVKLRNEPRLAGVAGLVEEAIVANEAFVGRARRGDTSTAASSARALNMGGLYRADAIREVGYLTDRNLHSFEELDLGLRLAQRGWSLERIALPSVKHYGPTVTSASLMRRRWRTRYAWGHGQLLRASFGAGRGWRAIAGLRVLRPQAFTMAAWSLLLFVSMGGVSLIAATHAAALMVSAWAGIWLVVASAKRSFSAATYSLSAWHVGLAGLVCGFIKPVRVSPEVLVDGRELQ